jgi:release factor glutamine methyltransferase
LGPSAPSFPYVALHDPHLREGDVRFEPAAALASGVDGVRAIRQIVAGARARLAPGARSWSSMGVRSGGEGSRARFVGAGFAEVVAARDLAGIPRVLAGGSFAAAEAENPIN